MMNKIEKLLDLCIKIAEKQLDKMEGAPIQLALPLNNSDPKPAPLNIAEPAAAPMVGEPKKTRKPRAAKEPVNIGGTSTPEEKEAHRAEMNGESVEDQLGIEGEKKPAMTEEESKVKMEEVTKQFVSLCKNDKPEDGKTRAIRLMKETFKVAKLGELSHQQRMAWIGEMEKGILEHK